ncbi:MULTISPECIES: c-type cytochrome [Arenibacter]|uniref:c-type cytochrome n=1 Tax=Arenibacter TaxID=178469 RepID=UPI00068BE2D6|nr:MULTISPECIES: cytochrome c [Arenibacter]GBF19433.1 cytochrome c-552 precursor [Arenibacter sp. NBRC 103722]
MQIYNRCREVLKKLFLTILSIFVLSSCTSRSKKETEKDPGTMTQTGSGSRLSAEPIRTTVPDYMEEGKKIFLKNCLVCHQSTGEGVPGLNPPLTNTLYVLGDKGKLLDILINGSDVGLVVKGSTYSNAMPSFGPLNDTAISKVASYIRNSFGNSAEPITVEDVVAFRLNTNK